MSLIERVYYFGYTIAKFRGLKNQKRLPYPVISVGNLMVGGTGKTPAVIAIAEEAEKRGYDPVILTRGYKGLAKDPCFVSRGRGLLISAVDSGDEPALMAEKLPGVVIVKSADRYVGGLMALNDQDLRLKNPLFILDDGFQNWRLSRDIDIVLVDGIRAFGARKLLPLGDLREPLAEIKRADVMVITKTRNDELASELRAINRSAPIYFSEYRSAGLKNREGFFMEIEAMRGGRVFAFCGIANPESFRNTLESNGIELIEFMTYRDHYNYSMKDISRIIKAAERVSSDFILTTEKDMVKIRHLENLPSNFYALQVEFCVDKIFFDDVFEMISKKHGER